MGDADESAPLKNDLFHDNPRTYPCSDDDSTGDITALSSLASPSNATSATNVSATVLLRARITLLVVAFLFGSFNVVLRLLYEMPGPPSASVLSAVRGWLAVMCFVPALVSMWRQRRIHVQKHDDSYMSEEESLIKNTQICNKPRPMLRAAFELAVWNFGALAFLNVGLLFVESARASFLTQMSVVITPLISSVCGQKVERTVWVGCAVALVGLVLLSDKGRPMAAGDDDEYIVEAEDDGIWAAFHSILSCLSFSAGDLLVLGGAISWSMYIFRLSSLGNFYPEVRLQAFKTVIIAILYTSWVIVSAIRCYLVNDGGWDAVTELWLGWKSWQAWALLLFSAVATGAVADILQQWGQRHASASEANILLCIEPVFTMMLGRVLLGEITSAEEKLGGILIVFAAILASR